MATKLGKRCSAIREIQVKTTMRYQYIPIRTAQIIVTIPNTGKNVEKLDLSCIAGGNVKQYTLENGLAVF